ncbi:hypothetical protein ACFOLF_21265 [Paenibacillus sepulcri]|uniref:WW domain-containing protein n=1 Tax=Paenibacillus sepulcri TaxID=359917 RepID=A0ABS7BWL4_9BACL|nr:hypothetical protein [Paenibacillus sepulcri]
MYLQQYPISTCPICKQGWVVIVKEVVSNKYFVNCNDCETEWENPESFLMKESGTHFKFGRVIEPEEVEVKAIGWEKYVSKELKSRIT